MRDLDRDYLAKRLADESTRAHEAGCDVARAVHRQLAELYAARLAEPRPKGSLSEQVGGRAQRGGRSVR